MSKESIDYYFDFLSPYSYLSWQWVRTQQSNFKFDYYPVILAQVIHHYDTKGPAEIQPMRDYLFKHCLRLSTIQKIPFKTPEKLPFNSLYALRMSLVRGKGISQFEVIDAIFQAGWGLGKDIGSPEVLVEILNAKNLPGEFLLEQVSDRDIRKLLKNNITKAHEKSVFGLPCFMVDDELFWGNDSIEHLELYLRGSDPLDRSRYQAFVEKFGIGDRI